MGKGRGGGGAAAPMPPTPPPKTPGEAPKARSPDPNVKSALHAIAKAEETNLHELPFRDVPPELLCAQTLDLRTWSMVVRDSTLVSIARETRRREAAFVERAMRELPVPKIKAAVEAKPGSATEAAAALSDARRRARQEAYEQQRLRQLEKARAAARERAHDEVGLKTLRVGGASKLGNFGVATCARAAPRLETLDLRGAVQVTDVALRETALACANLQWVDLRGCAGLQGKGIAAIGQRCPLIRTMRLGGCSKAATGWALACLLKGCGPSLTELDLSHCSLLTDADCGQVAKYCTNLLALDVSHCRNTGDQGAVEIADKCQRIERINLARSELPHKLTDVALLSVAEGCGRTLREVDIRGCEKVTDVGVSWLAHQAGATLEVFLLRDCNRVTNAGCRAIADHCVAIKRVDLRGARRVTDVGVRVLGQALGETLEGLDLGSMHLLTDGVDRGFGFEGLLALAQDVRALTSLHLDGCFQVGNRSLLALAGGCDKLVELGLAGCPRLSVEGVGALVGKSRNSMKRITLACCGDCVTNDLVIALARGAPFLDTLCLRDCERWGQIGARSLARHCKWLKRLDLTGCAGLDDEAVNCFAECHWKPPGLRHLVMPHVPGFGDIGLSWLVEGPGSKGLVTLSMFRCACTSAALKSVRDSFPHSEMKRDGTFFGFWPKPRWEHRLQIHDFAKDRRGIVKIQSAYRALLGRRVAKRLRDLRALDRATLVLQKHFRGYRGRERYRRLRAEFVRDTFHATVLAAFARGCFARARALRKRRLRAFRLATAGAIRVQKVYRGLVARRYAAMKAKYAAERKKRRLAACGDIQRIFRGVLGRARFQRFLDAFHAEEALRHRSAACIQRCRRCFLARARVRDLREKKARREDLYQKSATMVQCRIRLLQTVKVIRRKRRLRAARLRVALFLQCCCRARKSQIIMFVAAAEKRHKREQAAAETIQRAQRCMLARAVFGERRAEELATRAARLAGTIVIQSHARAWAARAVHRQLVVERDEFDRRMAEIEVWAAERIEACWRGHCGRVRAVAVRDEKRSRWKEMFDEDTQRPFYYNQISGEIRWRRPQDLLELMKRPFCGNCEFFEASLECCACKEFFCADCHAQVHYGGKRAQHPFRALYDAYGRRVDYGDGDFDLESMWPSEILQDDVAGILLRISPHREPAETVGVWQRYDDADTGASYYYNPVSGEGTYDEPAAVAEHYAVSALQYAKEQSGKYGGAQLGWEGQYSTELQKAPSAANPYAPDGQY